MSTQTGSISFESTKGLQSYAKQNYATLSQIKGQFATCGTGASTAAKVATIVPENNDWALYTGATVTVKFTSENTTSAPTLNVNGTGAKPIKDYNGNNLTKAAYEWVEGAAMALTYDGSSWRIQDSNLMERVHSAETNIEQNANEISLRATKEEVNNAIDDIKITKSACGRSILTEDTAADLPLLDLTIYGECSQDGTPTPDAPVEIKAVQGKNLFKAKYTNMIVNTNGTITASTGVNIYVAAVSRNTDYTVSAIGKDRCNVTKVPSENISSGMSGTSLIVANANASTFNSGDADYVAVYLCSTGIETEPQLERGSIPTSYVPYGHVAAIATGDNLLDPAHVTLHGCNGSVTDGLINVTATTGSASNGIKLGWFPPGTYTINADSFDGTTNYKGTRLISNLQVASNWIYNQYYPSILNERSHDAYYKDGVTYPFTFTVTDWFYLAFCASTDKDKTFTATSLRMVKGSTDRPYSAFVKDVSYIDLKGEELCGFDDTYRDMLTVNASGHAIIEKRTNAVTVPNYSEYGLFHGYSDAGEFDTVNGFSIYGSAANAGVFNLAGYNDVSNVRAKLMCDKLRVMTVNDKTATDALLRAYGTTLVFNTSGTTNRQETKDRLNEIAPKVYYPLAQEAWYTVDLGYIDLPTAFPSGTVHVDAEIQPQICGSWWTKSGQEAGAAHQSSVKENAELRIAADGITSEVSKISSAKYVNSSVTSWTLDAIKTNATDDGVVHTWNISSSTPTTDFRVGDTVYVKCIWTFTENSTTKTSPVYIKTTVKAINSATQFTAVSHGYENALPIDSIKSTINQSADSVKIQAKHVDIEGAAIFSSGGSYDKSTTVVKTETQWYSSTSATTKAKGTWGTTQPTITAGRYIWQRELVTYANGTTAYKPSEAGVCIQGQTDLSAYSTTQQMNTAIGGAVNTASDAITSRGEQLVTNGSAFMGNNTNFSNWIYDGTRANVSGGSFTHSISYSAILISDEFIPIDGNSIYEFSFDAVSENGDARLYGVFYCYDIDENAITAANILYIDGSTTTLAQDLKAGDTYVYLTDASGFDPAGKDVNGAYSRSFIFWDYVNSKGYAWPTETYSRHLLNYDKWASHSSIDYANNRILLKTAYSGTTVPAGTPVSQGNSGSTYEYPAAVNALIPSNWQHYSGYVCPKGATAPSGANATLRPGTAKAKVGFLWNYGGSTSRPQSQIWVTNISLMKKRVTDAELAAVKATADAAAPKANAVSRTQRIYYQSASTTKPSTPGTVSSDWVSDESGAPDKWTLKRMSYSSAKPYIYTCEQKQVVSGTVSYTPVLLDDTTTVIDGGKIITGSVTANALNAANINASKTLTIGAFQESTQEDILNSNIQVGGKNLLLNTGASDWFTKMSISRSNIGSATNTLTTDDDMPGFQVLAITRPNSAAQAGTYTNMYVSDTILKKLEIDKTYTISFYAKASTTGVIMTPQSIAEAQTMISSTATFEVATTWTRYSVTFIAKSTKQALCLYSNGTANAVIKYTKFQLESGNVVTDWSPAPEDTQASIDSLSDYTNSIRNWYATCPTAAATAAKVATIDPATTDFITSILTPGTVVFVKFTITNSAAVGDLTLNVNNTGAKPIRQVRNGTVQNLPGVGYLAANATYQFTYDGTNWLYTGNYDSNSNDNARYVQFYNTIVAGEALAKESVIGGRTDGKFYQIKENSSFDLSHPLLWTTIALAKDATNYANIYTQCYDRNLATFYTSFTNTTSNRIVYLVGTVNGNMFTTYGSNSSQYLTINPPTTEDGRFYIPIGRLGNQSNGKNYFNYQVGVPITLYAYIDGKFRQVTPTEIVATHRIYYRTATANNSLAVPTAWIDEATANVYNTWTTKVPPLANGTDSSVTGYTRYPYLYTCEQRKRLDGTVECTKVLLDENTTVIDGGNIITNSIAANKIKVNEINIGSLAGEIGGRNLIIDSKNFRVGSVESSSTMNQTTENGMYKMVISAGNTSNWNSGWWPNKDSNWSNVETNLKTGDPFVISFRIKATGSTVKPTIYIKPGLGYYSMIGTLSSDWSTIYYTGTWNDSKTIHPHLGWSGVSTASTYYIESVKLEKGNKPTDWSPAPEDVDSAIDDASKVASNYITHIDNSGIKIHPQSGESNRVSIDGSAIWMYRNNYLKAKYADTITLYGGSNAGGANPKVELTSTDFKMTDSVGTQRLLLNSSSGAIIGHPSKGRTQITDAGMTVYDTNNKARSVINASGLDVKDTDGSTSVALFAASSRIGKAASGHVLVDSTGMTVYDTNNKKRTAINASGLTVYDASEVDVGNFAATARIGKTNSSRFLMNADSLQGYNSSNKLYFEVSSTGIKYGSDLSATGTTNTVASQSYVTGRGYQTSSQVTDLINTNQNVIDAKKHTQVIISATNVNYVADTCTLTARLYIDGVLQTSTSLKWQWYRDGTVQGSQTTGATGTLNVTSTLGIAHRYSCKCTF